MKLKRGEFIGLHGHISKNIEFSRDVNILIGVNGSGKTTLLNAIAWVLSPESIHRGQQSAYHLSQLTFEKIAITFTLPKRRKYQNVTATHTGECIVISARDVDDTLEIPVLPDPPPHRMSTLRYRDDERDIIAEHMTKQRTTQMSKYLNSFITPLYVPLDRRWSESHEVGYRRRRLRRYSAEEHLPIDDVLRYVDNARRQEQTKTDDLNYDLRNQLLASLFERPDSTAFADRLTLLPLNQIRNHRTAINSALESLGMPAANKRTKAFFDTLEDTVTKLQDRDLTNIGPEDSQYNTWVNWVIHGSPLADRVSRLVPLINQYENKRLSVTEPSRSFLKSINTFLADSGKELSFSDSDVLTVTLDNGMHTSAANLSSGELQLLTLFTFLYFRYERQQEFTIIIDEPELSLHLAWLGNYLESVTSANPNAQFVVATHSPEIAGPFRDRLIDISP